VELKLDWSSVHFWLQYFLYFNFYWSLWDLTRSFFGGAEDFTIFFRFKNPRFYPQIDARYYSVRGGGGSRHKEGWSRRSYNSERDI